MSNRKQRVRVGSSISKWLEVLLGVPQGSVLGPILFNVFINDLLFSVLECDVCNFADDNTLFSCKPDLNDVLENLRSDISLVSNWFNCNGMVANPEKFQMIILGADSSNISIQTDFATIKPSKEVTLLGVAIDDKLSFYPHIKEVCLKASLKIKGIPKSVFTGHQ